MALGLALGLSACKRPADDGHRVPRLAAAGSRDARHARCLRPSDEQGQRFAAIFAQEARSRGFVLADASAPVATTRLRAYLDSFMGADGKPAISYVLQTSADGRTRANRISGTVAASAAGWSGLDDATMRRVAVASLDDLTRQLTGQPGAGGEVALASEEAQ